MAQPKNAIYLNYTSNKNSVIHGENFRYASNEMIKKARGIFKSEGALFSYHAESDWYVLDGAIGRLNGDSSLKLLAHPDNRKGLEKLAETLGLPK